MRLQNSRLILLLVIINLIGNSLHLSGTTFGGGTLAMYRNGPGGRNHQFPPGAQAIRHQRERFLDHR